MNQELFLTYRETNYRVPHDSHLVLREDEPNIALDALRVDRDVTTIAFAAAWYPLSHPVSKSENDIAQARLRSEVTALGLDVLPGEGVGRDGTWPAKPSLLVPSISHDQAEHSSKNLQAECVHLAHPRQRPEQVVTRD